MIIFIEEKECQKILTKNNWKLSWNKQEKIKINNKKIKSDGKFVEVIKNIQIC